MNISIFEYRASVQICDFWFTNIQGRQKDKDAVLRHFLFHPLHGPKFVVWKYLVGFVKVNFPVCKNTSNKTSASLCSLAVCSGKTFIIIDQTKSEQITPDTIFYPFLQDSWHPFTCHLHSLFIFLISIFPPKKIVSS